MDLPRVHERIRLDVLPAGVEGPTKSVEGRVLRNYGDAISVQFDGFPAPIFITSEQLERMEDATSKRPNLRVVNPDEPGYL